MATVYVWPTALPLATQRNTFAEVSTHCTSISAPIFWPAVETVSESAARSLMTINVSTSAEATLKFWSTTPRKRYHHPSNARDGFGSVKVTAPEAPALVKTVPGRSSAGLTV